MRQAPQAPTIFRPRRRQAAAAAPLLALLLAAPARAAAPAPLALHYEAYALGFPVVSIGFRLDESGAHYALDSEVKTTGLLRLIYRLDLDTASRGRIEGGGVEPRRHDQEVRTRHGERRAMLDYRPDGSVAAALEPPEDRGRPKPTPAQTLHTLDPLSALLAIGRSVAAAGHCGGRFPVYDGRRRYDLVLGDEGAAELEKSGAFASAGVGRRCSVTAVKIAGFSWDQDYSPHTTTGRVWFASPVPGAPAMPVRIEFGSSWGFVSVRLTGIGPR
jgi:Protein of unknown function (DUF3108)